MQINGKSSREKTSLLAKFGLDYKRFTPNLPVVSVYEPTNSPLQYELFYFDGKKYLLQASEFGPQLLGSVIRYRNLPDGRTSLHIKKSNKMDKEEKELFYDWMSRFWTSKIDAQAER